MSQTPKPKEKAMENQVLVVVLKENMTCAEILEAMTQLKRVEGVLIVKTFEAIVDDALPIPTS